MTAGSEADNVTMGGDVEEVSGGSEHGHGPHCEGDDPAAPMGGVEEGVGASPHGEEEEEEKEEEESVEQEEELEQTALDPKRSRRAR